jgi:hypothetical protein
MTTDPEVLVDEEEHAAEEAIIDAESSPEQDEFDQADESFTSLHERVERIKANDQVRGLYRIGAGLIDEYGCRADWDEDKRGMCTHEITQWASTPLHDPAILADDNLPPPLSWVALGTGIGWQNLKEFAEIVLSLPASEAENERTFSVRKSRWQSQERLGDSASPIATRKREKGETTGRMSKSPTQTPRLRMSDPLGHRTSQHAERGRQTERIRRNNHDSCRIELWPDSESAECASGTAIGAGNGAHRGLLPRWTPCDGARAA